MTRKGDLPRHTEFELDVYSTKQHGREGDPMLHELMRIPRASLRGTLVASRPADTL